MAKKKHSVEEIKPELEINERLSLHEKGWVVQRVGWVIISLVVVAGALGLFGEGPLSKKTLSSGNIKAEYERFFRYEAEMKIRLQSGDEHIAHIALPQQYVQNFRIVRFEPQPENNQTVADNIVFRFLPEQNRIVSIYLVPKSTGAVSGVMQVNGRHQYPLHHFIYP